MKLVFCSNYYNHHQSQISNCFFRLLEGEFSFIETAHMREERKALGYTSKKDPFVCFANTEADCAAEMKNADVVIFGSASEQFIAKRQCEKKLVFRYSERIYKEKYQWYKWPARLLTFYKNYGRHRNTYLLCASAYTAADYALHGTFVGKSYKWGYFPETKRYKDIQEVISKKTATKILWCGRFLRLKHPEAAIEVVYRLREAGYEVELDFIGTGEQEKLIRQQTEYRKIEDCVRFLGAMSPSQVREHMEKSGIYLFTSDFHEGWGAVLNESMNSGCAVVASHAIGSVPFLLKHGENGLVYENGDIDDLYEKVKFLLDNPNEQKRIGENAYHTIVDLWNAEIATKRFIHLVEEIQRQGYCDLYSDGPCSRASVLKNNWFRKGKDDIIRIEKKVD